MRILFLVLATLLLGCGSTLMVTPIGQLETEGAAEIVAFDATKSQLFVINGSSGWLEIVDMRQPSAPRVVGSVDLTPYGASANSVALRGDLVAVAIAAPISDEGAVNEPGKVVFFDTLGCWRATVAVGAGPDMLTFTPDGRTLLVANEGEPKDYCEPGLANDPEGSISVIDLSDGVAGLTQAQVATAGFEAFNAGAPAGVRVFGPGATVAQDLEPEYIAVSSDSKTAWVTLQENNALAVLDIGTATVTDLVPLGTQDHSLPRNALDASDEDGGIHIQPWPVRGMYQPDAIASLTWRGETYLLTANEGDAREYGCFKEEARVAELKLDGDAFPDGEELQNEARLGRLKVSSVEGEEDGVHRALHSFGSRSVSLWSEDGTLVWDSGDDFERLAARETPKLFNANGPRLESFDSRSDDKGPEPEGVVLGTLGERLYAFVGLERAGAIVVYDVTDPRKPALVRYVVNRTAEGGPRVGARLDSAPEGLLFIPATEAPGGQALLVVANEVSGTVTVYSVELGSKR